MSEPRAAYGTPGSAESDRRFAEALLRAIRGMRHALHAAELAVAEWLKDRATSHPEQEDAQAHSAAQVPTPRGDVG